MPGKLAIAVWVLVVSSSAFADVYTWTDPLGGVHFTDTPPLDQSLDPVQIAVPVTVPMANNLDQQRHVSKIHKQVRDVFLSDHKSSSGGGRSTSKAEAKHKKSCAGYRRRLAHIQSQLRAGYSNNKGNSLRAKRRKYNQLLSRECILR